MVKATRGKSEISLEKSGAYFRHLKIKTGVARRPEYTPKS
jgi:hypothetical protein